MNDCCGKTPKAMVNADVADTCRQQAPEHSDNVLATTSSADELTPSCTKSSARCTTRLRIRQMDCPTEEALIRHQLSGINTIQQLEFNLLRRELTIVHDAAAYEAILLAIRQLGFSPEPADSTAAADSAAELASQRKAKQLLAAALVAALCSELFGWLGLPPWSAALLALLAIALSGLTTYKKGWVALRHGNLNINALMSIAVTGAMLLGQWSEAAVVMVLFSVAEMIEAQSLDRARNAIAALMKLSPERVTLQQDDGSWSEVDARLAAIGRIARVRPGERIALDGTILSGSSTVNQAPITGESLPVDKVAGDAVFAGTVNGAGAFEYRISAASDQTMLARIIRVVEASQGAKAPTQRFIDRFSMVYTPVVFVLALLIAVVPPLVLAGPWQDWLYKALVLLVIACPCALVISTPVTIVSGLAAAARRGILIKGGVYLEAGRTLKWLALDKTGTITQGTPAQTDFLPLGPLSASDCRELAASLANLSDHPVSRAIATAAATDNIHYKQVAHFSALPGAGVRGAVNGQTLTLTNHRFLRDAGLSHTALQAQADTLEQQGKTVVILADNQQALALFAVADTIKPTSVAAIAALHALGVKTVMLTGDNRHTAETIARQAGLDLVYGDQLPDDKLQMIATLAQQGTVGMVGDGINDAPALARSDIGFAMGVMGTDTAIETADVALMDDDLRKIASFITLSKTTHYILLQNIGFALGIKALFVALTLTGHANMWMAVFADVGASLLVVANGLRLLRQGRQPKQ